MAFYENLPSVVTIDYLNMTDNGMNATVGVEAQTGEYSPLSSVRTEAETVLQEAK